MQMERPVIHVSDRTDQPESTNCTAGILESSAVHNDVTAALESVNACLDAATARREKGLRQ